MNRREFIYSVSSIPAFSLLAPRGSALERSQSMPTRCSESDGQSVTGTQLRVGVVGVAGIGVYHLDRVAQSLNFRCRTIAIETDKDRLRSCHARQSLLISDHGSDPATIRDAQLMARDRKNDISRLLSSLDVAFILTGLNGVAGKGVSSVAAEVLGELGVFTVAIVPGRREPETVKSLQRLVDVLFEVPYEPLMDEARTRQCRLTGLVSGAIAKICRALTHSLAQSESVEANAAKLRWLLRGEGPSEMGYGDGNGTGGWLQAFNAARHSLLIGADRLIRSRGQMVFVEARPGILRNQDLEVLADRMRKTAPHRAKFHFSAFESEHLSTDYRVTILARA